MRRLLTLIVLLLPALLLAQSKVHLEFQSGGPRIGWVADQLGPPPDKAAKWDEKSYDLATPDGGPDSIVQVLDTASGNVATKKLSAIGRGWLVRDSDFKLIGHVKLRVEHDGAPVEVAGLNINDGARAQSTIIDSSSKGVADFFDVKPGNLSVTVNYHSDKANKTQKQAFTIDLKRDSPTPLLVVSITSPVATLAASSLDTSLTLPKSDQGGKPIYTGTKASPSGQTFGSVVVYLLAIGFAILVVYLGFTWLQNNHAKAQAALQKFGISLQDPVPHDPSVGVPVTRATAQPVQQILLQDAAPTPLAGMPMPSLATAVQASSPQLRGENGKVIPIADGTSLVSRDAGFPISLPGESSVSRKHAEIVKDGPNVVVRDLGSTNGTYVNGNRVDGEAIVRTGDTLQFGTVRFRYEG